MSRRAGYAPGAPRLGRVSELSDTEAGRLFETASTWAEIDLDAIRGNIAAVIAAASPDAAAGEPVTDRRPAVMAVVKANGYGHGAVEVARAALDGGATWLGVARAEEALVLRAAGVDAPLLLLGYVPPDAVPAMVAHEVSLTLWSAEQIRAVAAQLTGTDAGVPARIHLKIDTGMRRIGCPPAQARPLLELVAELAAAGAPLRAEGVFTHFACADSADKTIAGEQLAAFGAAVDELTAAGLRPPLVHAANSAATITMPAARFDMVRYGIALYGLLPGPAVTLPAGTRPALTWRAVLSRVTEVPAGQGVGYGHTYRTGSHPERIGTVPVGYADGWRRIDGN